MPDPRQDRQLHVLAVNPFHGGSHREFLRGAAGHSRHRWTLLAGKPVHWKWRMRSAPLELAGKARERIQSDGYPDVVVCTDMLDLPQWRGLLGEPRVLQTPTAVYFHENQWTYPLSPSARVDFHFGYTNLLSALAADVCWFNSVFHRDDFLRASQSFVERMPDARAAHDFDRLAGKCRIIPPGFDPGPMVDSPPRHPRDADRPIHVGWVSRWEHDKRPDRLLDLVARLDRQGVDFRLVLLGHRPPGPPSALNELRDRFANRIAHDGYLEKTEKYWDALREIDVVVSTADHEFFGIAVCQAIWAGATPVLPNRLSYPELAPRECLYDSLDEAVSMIAQLSDAGLRGKRSASSRKIVAPLRIEHTAGMLDEALCRLAERGL